MEHLVLFFGAQAGVQRQNLSTAQIGPTQHLGSFTNLTLTGQKDQNIPRACAPLTFPLNLFDLFHRLQNPLMQVLVEVALIVLFQFHQRTIDYIYWESTAGNFDHRCVAEMLGEAIRIDSGGGDDQFQIRAFRQQLFQVTQQKIDIEAAFVGLINNDHFVSVQKTVILGFSQQDTIGHQLNERVISDLIGKTYLITYLFAQRYFQLFCHTVGNGSGCQTAGLGMTNQSLDP